MLREHEINQLDNFIMGWYIDTNLCDLLIEYHKNTPNKWQAHSGYEGDINLSNKNSIDCKLIDENLSLRYFDILQQCVDLYCGKYTFSKTIHGWKTIELPNLQHYIPPDGGYHKWHCERDRGDGPNGKRVMVFMTYLNDVTDKGETEFYYQKIKVKAEKGLTLMWPSDWTFTHRGIASPTQEKYIYTGWFSFFEGLDK
jgi:hypothetical protein